MSPSAAWCEAGVGPPGRRGDAAVQALAAIWANLGLSLPGLTQV